MRILILGGDGMLGHQLFKHLQLCLDVRVTLRQEMTAYTTLGLFNHENAYTGIDVRSIDRVTEVLADYRPQAVVNCVGIVKQRPTAKESIPSMEINALLPHRLSVLCKAAGSRLIHMSTDCVFSGRKGSYQEDDLSDAEDLYGKTKFLGEVHDDHCLTLRTSIIGREISRKTGLLEWFLGQSGTIKGFKKAIYTGFTTIEMSKIIEKILIEYPNISGMYQVSSDPINKFDLLTLVKEKMGLDVEIIADETFQCDRSLSSTRFRKEFKYTLPTWNVMIEEFVKDFKDRKV